MKFSYFIGAGFVLAVSTAAASLPGQDSAPSPASGPAYDADAALNTFLADKTSAQAASMAAFQRRGKGGDAAELRRLVRGALTDPPRPLPALDASRSERLTESLANDAADYLAGLGYGPGTLRSERGFDRSAAAVRLIRGTSSQDDRLGLAPWVVAVEIVDVVFEDLGDGYHSTVIARPVDVVKAPRGAAAPTEIRIRQMSGATTARGRTLYSSEFAPGQRGTFLLALSDEFYQHSATVRGGASRGRSGSTLYMVRVAPDSPPVAGSGTSRTVRLETGAASLEQLRSRLEASGS